jgi:hypothetical protein
MAGRYATGVSVPAAMDVSNNVYGSAILGANNTSGKIKLINMAASDRDQLSFLADIIDLF